MKKLLFAASTLDLGGIETALITLINTLVQKEYEITLVLEKKQGVFMNEVNEKIKIVEYNPCDSKWYFYRKIVNLLKRINFNRKYRNKFDFSACFATYSLSAGFAARTASSNCALWGHADYLALFHGNKEEMKLFFKQRHYDKFQHLIFVSEEGRDSFISLFPEMKDRVMVCNNLIDAEKIGKKAQQEIEIEKANVPTFVNVGRHDERQKKLTRIIQAAARLKKEGYAFQVFLVGDGKDTDQYKEQVKQEGLEKQILFLGKQANPYPYYRISDYVILSSDYEGYPVVFLESFILGKPIITTKVSDYSQVEGKFGVVVEKDTQAIYEAMKQWIEHGYIVKEKFDVEQYNDEIQKKLEKIF